MTVYQKQALLAYLGYYKGSLDGIWGDASVEATKAFQKGFGLDADGVAGEKTQKALKHAVAYGSEKKSDCTDYNTNVSPDCTNVQKDNTGTFWDRIKYFRREEDYIGCPCGKCGGFPVEPSEELMRLADAVREHFGAPMIPTSTVRCQAHNDSLPGSAKNSYHVRGKAIDFVVRGHSAKEVVAYVKTLGVHYTYAINENAVHMDVA